MMVAMAAPPPPLLFQRTTTQTTLAWGKLSAAATYSYSDTFVVFYASTGSVFLCPGKAAEKWKYTARTDRHWKKQGAYRRRERHRHRLEQWVEFQDCGKTPRSFLNVSHRGINSVINRDARGTIPTWHGPRTEDTEIGLEIPTCSRLEVRAGKLLVKLFGVVTICHEMHLAAQAGVRYAMDGLSRRCSTNHCFSITPPLEFVASNLWLRNCAVLLDGLCRDAPGFLIRDELYYQPPRRLSSQYRDMAHR
ncbi:putative UDP-glucuronate 4-epimerase 1 [Sesbania bispinosa]|nr:putative UDP-glucuronate 4-epimerase 1 [Sesbania bispinosa]